MGILFSRSIETLLIVGEYIFLLYNDDMLLDKDVYSTVTQIVIKKNLIL